LHQRGLPRAEAYPPGGPDRSQAKEVERRRSVRQRFGGALISRSLFGYLGRNSAPKRRKGGVPKVYRSNQSFRSSDPVEGWGLLRGRQPGRGREWQGGGNHLPCRSMGNDVVPRKALRPGLGCGVKKKLTHEFRSSCEIPKVCSHNYALLFDPARGKKFRWLQEGPAFFSMRPS
jgi:hypothetical protein